VTYRDESSRTGYVVYARSRRRKPIALVRRQYPVKRVIRLTTGTGSKRSACFSKVRSANGDHTMRSRFLGFVGTVA